MRELGTESSEGEEVVDSAVGKPLPFTLVLQGWSSLTHETSMHLSQSKESPMLTGGGMYFPRSPDVNRDHTCVGNVHNINI